MMKPTRFTIMRFLGDTTVPQFDGVIGATELFQGWKQWCDANNVYPLSANWFGRTITDGGAHRRKSNGRIVYMGMRWNEEAK